MRIKKFASALAVILIALTFVWLGKWQLDRATDLKSQQEKAKLVDETIYPLNALAQPSTSLDSRNVGKFVQVHGNYVANFKAPNQVDKNGRIADWEVALLQVDASSGILVLRGLWSERLNNPEVAMSTGIDLVGTLQPHQNEDHGDNAPGVLSRLDSSVIVSLTDLKLFDGFIAATSEQTREGKLSRTYLEVAQPISKVAGFYWQHIAYVGIWWLMALVTLFLPFYKGRVKP